MFFTSFVVTSHRYSSGKKTRLAHPQRALEAGTLVLRRATSELHSALRKLFADAFPLIFCSLFIVTILMKMVSCTGLALKGDKKYGLILVMLAGYVRNLGNSFCPKRRTRFALAHPITGKALRFQPLLVELHEVRGISAFTCYFEGDQLRLMQSVTYQTKTKLGRGWLLIWENPNVLVSPHIHCGMAYRGMTTL